MKPSVTVEYDWKWGVDCALLTDVNDEGHRYWIPTDQIEAVIEGLAQVLASVTDAS